MGRGAKICSGVVRAGAGWLLIAALIYAPWDYGAIGASAIHHLNWLLGLIFALWLVSLADRRGRRFPSFFLIAISVLLLLLAWGMALNAHAVFDTAYSLFMPMTSPLPKAPGSVNYALSLATARRATVLLGSIWIVTDLSQDPRWLLRICWGIALGGGSIALLGLLQKATGAEMIFWAPLEPGEPPVKTFFATYYYHGNAGAFLNLALPAVIGLAYRSVTRPSNPVARALALTLALIMVVAVISNTSRMGQFIAALITLVLLFLSAGKIFRRLRALEMRTATIGLAVSVLALWAIVRVSHLDQSLGRWELFRQSWENDARWLVDQAALAALPEAGPFGFGPGTFPAVFPHYNLDKRAEGVWLHLHNDHLQTMMEWGWLGALLWDALFVGGMFVAGRELLTRRDATAWLPRQRLIATLGLVALTGVGLHALVDFPLQIYSIQLYAATWLGLCWGSRNWKGTLARAANSRS